MANLFSCLWQNKKAGEYSPQESARRSERQGRENSEVVYVETGGFIDKDAGNLQKFNGNVRTVPVYRTETVSQTPQHEKLFGLDKNGQSRSYPVSPERRPLHKVYSFEQRPSLEKQNVITNRDSKNVIIYAANVPANNPHLNQTTKLSAARVNNYANIQENERYTALRTSKEGNDKYFSRSSNTGNGSYLNLTGNSTTDSRIETVVRLRPRSSRSSSKGPPGRSVKVMTYRAQDVYRSPMMTRKPVRADKQPPLLTTQDGRVLMPLTSVEVKRTSTLSNKEKKPARLSGRHLPLETDEAIIFAEGGKNIVAAPMISGGGVEGFPLAKGGEVIVAAPMMEGRRQSLNSGRTSKSTLSNETGSGAPYNRHEVIDDYYMGDIYSYGSDYGRGNYRQSYYDDYYPYSNSGRYSPGMSGGYYDDPRGGYYDDLRGGYYADPRGGYYDGPRGGYYDDVPCSTCSGRRGMDLIYAAQMPEIVLPDISDNKGRNSQVKKTDRQADAPETCIGKDFCELKRKKPENINEQFSKESALKLTQPTNFKNEMELTCFPPESDLKTRQAPNDPNSKLRWRIIIKKGDEE